MNSINDICEGLLDDPEVVMDDKTKDLWGAYIVGRWMDPKPNCDALQNPLAPGDTVLYMPAGVGKSVLLLGTVLKVTSKTVTVVSKGMPFDWWEFKQLSDEHAKIRSINYQMIGESKVSQDRCIKISKESLYSI